MRIRGRRAHNCCRNLNWVPIGAKSIQERFGVGPGDVVFRESAKVENANTLPDGNTFVTYQLKHIVVVVAILLVPAIQRAGQSE